MRTALESPRQQPKTLRVHANLVSQRIFDYPSSLADYIGLSRW
jgi:hypothetical protein